jgi:hypothetical protein
MRSRPSTALACLTLLSFAALAACSSDDSSSGSPQPDSGIPTNADTGGGSGDDAMTGTPDATMMTPDSGTSPDSGPTGPVDASPSHEGGFVPEASTAACTYPLDGGAVNQVKYVFVIAMENHDSTQIVGNTASAPYINGTLLPCYASSSNFNDPLPIEIPSEPHYIWMEAGTNGPLNGVTFTNDDDSSAANSTSSTLHFSSQLDNHGVVWHTYQQGMSAAGSGNCPINSSGDYAAKHDPYVFFQDIVGSPPAADNAYCASHHSPLTSLAGDLSGATVAKFNFITPDLCHDMHGAGDCVDNDTVHAGDTFLAANMPALIDFAFANDGVIFIVWDEGAATLKIPFLAIGPSVKRGWVGGVSYTHSSLLATQERIFGVGRLQTVDASVNDLADLFQTGALP